MKTTGAMFVRRKSFFALLSVACLMAFFLHLPHAFSEDEMETATEKPATVQPSNHLSAVEGEIVEVNELKDPPGCAIYKVRVYETGETMELFADRDRSLILAGGESKNAPDILGGAKATIIYGEIKEQDLPVIVFARVASTSTT